MAMMFGLETAWGFCWREMEGMRECERERERDMITTHVDIPHSPDVFFLSFPLPLLSMFDGSRRGVAKG